MKYSKNHIDYYNEEGNEIPSATTIIKILNKPSLIKWSNYLGFKRIYTEEVLSNSSELGRTIHNLLDSIVNKKYIIYTHLSKSFSRATVYKCLNNFFNWYNNNDIEPIFTERSLVSDKFGGTVDFYGKVNNKLTIVDYKTSKDIYMSMFIQLSLYCILLEYNNYKVEQVGIVLVNEKNNKTKFISREELQPYVDMSIILIDLFHHYYNLHHKDKWKEDII